MKTYILCGLLLFSATSVRAQRVTTRGFGEADLDDVLRSALRGQHQLVTKDMTVGRNDTIRGNVVALRSRFIVEGTVLGDVVGVDANMYFRPTAVVKGTVTNIAGGLYPSELANIDVIEDRPLAPYHVRDDAGNLVVEGTNKRPALKLGGIFGVQNPEYNRVDGLRLEFGPSFLLPPFAGVEPSIFASIGYATERGDIIKRAGIGMERRRSTLTFGWEDDITLTNDRWIRSDLKNSLSFIWNGKDYRNYYAAERIYGEFSRILEKGDRTTRYWIRGQREDASPLTAGNPFVVLKPDSIRSNPIIPESSVTSLIAGAESNWTGLSSAWNITGWVETAGGALVDSDHAFNMFALGALYAMKAIANHTLEIEGNFRGPLPGTDELPQQRWTHVGGSGTLYTYDVAQFRGDRLAFIESEYTIPFTERLKLPLLGVPQLRLMHNIGMAWSNGGDSGFEQNIGARIQVTVGYVRYIMDPRTGEGKFGAGVSFPSKGYPWEKPQKSPLEK